MVWLNGDRMKFTIVTQGSVKNTIRFADYNSFLTALNDFKWAGYTVVDYLPYEEQLVLVMKR